MTSANRASPAFTRIAEDGIVWAQTRLAAVRQQGCSEIAPQPSHRTTAGSPNSPFASGVVIATLRVRNLLAIFQKAAIHQVVAPLADAAFHTRGRKAQKPGFAESCKAHQVFASILAERRSAAFELPTFVHRAAFLKADEPHSGQNRR